ncbi:hypothetical protein ACU6VI_13470 [Sphaerotilus natans]|uniref:hypothetical protein n=1 Tax=Sphaerotilus natans TaxID=34103 RepID=UPI00406BF825
MYEDKIIEITQDAACVIRNNSSEAAGFFTGDIETCIVLVIKTESVVIAIHDSAQLSVDGICSLIKRNGVVLSVTLIQGSNRSLHHSMRINIILSNIGYVGDIIVKESDYNVFSVVYKLNGDVTVLNNKIPDYVYEIPEKQKIQIIVELNNCFLPMDCFLPVDIQFCGGDYCRNSRLLFSLDNMLRVYNQQIQNRIKNGRFLKKGHEAGLFRLPSQVLFDVM